MIQNLRQLTLLFFLLVGLTGCGQYQGWTRYECQLYENWERPECNVPECKAQGVCTIDIFGGNPNDTAKP